LFHEKKNHLDLGILIINTFTLPQTNAIYFEWALDRITKFILLLFTLVKGLSESKAKISHQNDWVFLTMKIPQY